MKAILGILLGLSLSLLAGCSKSATPAELMKMAQSQAPYDRELAVYGLAEKYKPEYDPYLGVLLRDPDTSVRRAALKTIGKTRSRTFLPILRLLENGVATDEYKLVQDAIKELESVPSTTPPVKPAP